MSTVQCKSGRWDLEIVRTDDHPAGKTYQKEYGSDEGIPTTRYVVSIKENDQTISSAVLLGYRGLTGPGPSSFAVEGATIAVCVSDKVFCLEIPSLELRWEVIADDVSCFEIYSRQEGYFVHGELSMTKLTKSGEVEWQFRGRDIFTSPAGKDDFKLYSDRIVARDWQGYVYTLDLNGKLIDQ